MKYRIVQNIVPGLLAVGLLLFTACSSKTKVKKTATTAFEEGVPGGVLVETYDFTAKVTRVDQVNHTVTILAPDGSYNTFKAGPRDTTFPQLFAGAKAKAAVARELVIFLKKNGLPVVNSPSAESALADKEGAADVMVARDERQDAIVVGIDAQHRVVKLRFKDTSSKVFPLRNDVELSQMRPGDDVVIITRSAVKLSPTK